MKITEYLLFQNKHCIVNPQIIRRRHLGGDLAYQVMALKDMISALMENIHWTHICSSG